MMDQDRVDSYLSWYSDVFWPVLASLGFHNPSTSSSGPGVLIIRTLLPPLRLRRNRLGDMAWNANAEMGIFISKRSDEPTYRYVSLLARSAFGANYSHLCTDAKQLARLNEAVIGRQTDPNLLRRVALGNISAAIHFAENRSIFLRHPTREEAMKAVKLLPPGKDGFLQELGEGPWPP